MTTSGNISSFVSIILFESANLINEVWLLGAFIFAERKK
jgi:hypothetical protein